MALKTPQILTFDTALGGVTIALSLSDGRIVSRHKETAREQASLLIPMLQDVLEEGGATFQDLDAIACMIGPGSFTGLRIGMTTAKTLGLSLNKPVMGINTLDLMARHYDVSNHDGNLLIVLETKRKDFYACYYDQAYTPIGKPFAASAEDIVSKAPRGSFAVGGDAIQRFQTALKAKAENEGQGHRADLNHIQFLTAISYPTAEILTSLAREQYDSMEPDMPRIEPLYLRGADTSKPKHKPRQIASP